MTPEETLQSPSWYHATTLTERLAAWRIAGSGGAQGKANSDQGRQRLERWRSQPPFPFEKHFEQRLASDDLTEDEMAQILGEPIQAVQERLRIPPAWLVQIQQAFARPEPAQPLPEAQESLETAGFLPMIEPLILQGLDRVRQGVQSLSPGRTGLPFDPATVEEILFKGLPWHLDRLVSRTLVLEMHVARMQGLLDGETAAERFASFLKRLGQRDVALTILQEYPVLARQLALCINHWANFSLEFLEHLATDWPALRATLSPNDDPGLLVSIEGNAGDSHRGGRAVLIAAFASGFRVVYKPKSMAVDRHFQELLAWVNERGDHAPFKTLEIIDRGHYGWVEFIQAGGCTSPEEVQRFYERQGGFLALLYALEAMDFHSENLIAAGEHPILIDLEALFHPRADKEDLSNAVAVARHRIGHSVLNVSLLPQRIWSGEDSTGVDISGIGATAGQLTPYPVPQWEEVGTDAMHFTRKRMEMPGDPNRPSLGEADVDVMDYAEFIVAGFTSIYRLLERHRDELLADHGPVARFADDEVRVIIRATRIYSVLLSESFHPDVLRDALDRDRLFDRLWIGIGQSPHLARVIPSERDDLWRGDIPMFTTRAASRDLWDASGRRLADFFEESGMDLVQRRLRQFGDADLAEQVWVVRASLATVVLGGDRAPIPPYEVTEAPTPADREQLLAIACAIGDRLEERAVRGPKGDVSWVSLILVNERNWAISPLGVDLYDGLPGLALFLGYLGKISGDERYHALARAALVSTRLQLEEGGESMTSIGGFEGWGGIIYALAHLGALWKQPELFREAEAMAARLPSLIDSDESLEVIAGAAGCIGGLLSLYHCAPAESTLALARKCGDHIFARAQSMTKGVGWKSPMPARGPLTGFSHGAAGIAWALLELAAVTGEARYRETALAALAYERSLFEPEAGNWPDLRIDETQPTLGADSPEFGMSWCHGAPGIGLARIQSLRHLDDPATRSEIATAVGTTLVQGFGRNHTLCHGDMGNLELVVEAAAALGDSRWSAERDRLVAVMLESIKRGGWRCAIPFHVETPGLMTGLAGIGYGLLRLAEGRSVPSVLLMEPPPSSS